MAMESITQFPNLFATGNVQDKKASHHRFSLASSSSSSVIKSWALLLQSFTQHQDHVSFYVNGRSKTFHTSSLDENQEDSPALSAGPQGTGVRVVDSQGKGGDTLALHISTVDDPVLCTDEEGSLLLLVYDEASGSSQFRDPGFVPGEFLSEISRQLCALVEQYVENARSHGEEAETPLPRLSILNENPVLAKGPQLLHELLLPSLRSSTAKSTSAIEHMDGDGSRSSLTYSEFDERTDQLASYLTGLAISSQSSASGKVIPLLIPQCPQLYIAMLATLKAGYAFCPLNLDAPRERVRFVVEDVSAAIVLTLRSLRDTFTDIEGISVCCLDDDSSTRSLDPVSHNHRQARPQDLAYVMYTSGSTGQPKGVGLSHFAVTQSLLAHDTHIPPFSRFLQFAAPTFDVSQFEIFFTFYRSGTLISCDRKRLLNDLPRILRDMDVDGAELTPTVAGSLLVSRKNAPRIRCLLTIGEMLTRHVIEEFGGLEGRESLLQGMYGPTEAAIHCTLQPFFQADMKVGIIGIPLDTVSAFIVRPVQADEHPLEIHVLPLGQTGELAVGGHQLAVGYLNRPEQTQAAFVEDPRYGRLYRTGDKARILPSGLIECLGRISSGQVKLRGQRIELGEIEQVAMKADHCLLAIASVLQGNLVLFSQPRANIDPTESIQDTCAKWLPPFMIPNEILVFKDLPRLPSGKVDRKLLDAQYLKQQLTDEGEQQSDLQDGVLSDVVRVAYDSIGVKLRSGSSLSRSGVESLSAIRFASALRDEGYDANAIDILNAQSTRSLAASLRRILKTNETSDQDFEALLADLYGKATSNPLLRDLAGQVESILPCTPLQTSMLAETMLHKKLYCNVIAIRMPEKTSFAQFKSSLQRIAQQNDMLRSGFLPQDDADCPFLRIVWSDLLESQITCIDDEGCDFALSDDEHYLRPLKVTASQKAGLLQVSIQIHHALYDGWSLDLLLKDLNTILHSESLPSRPSFKAVNKSCLTLLDSAKGQAAKAFWKDRLSGMITPAAMPSMSRNDILKVRHRQSSVSVSKIRQHLGQSFHPQLLFQAAMLLIQHQASKLNDHVIGVVTTGRTVPVADVENIMGPFIATLPLRVSFRSTDTVASLLFQLQSLNRSLMQHCFLPLSEIKSLAGIPPGIPMFNVLMVWQESLESSSLKSSNIEKVREVNSLESPLFLELESMDGEIDMRVTYSESIVSTEVAKSVLESLDLVAAEVLQGPQAIISDLIVSIDPRLTDSDLLSLDSLEQDASQINGHGSPELSDNESSQLPELEHCVITALSESTKVSIFDIDRRARFFTYGLNSISAIYMSKRLRALSGVVLDISEVFAYPTVTQLAEHMSQKKESDNEYLLSIPNIGFDAMEAIKTTFQNQDRPVACVRPCTPLQEGMLSAEQLSRNHSYFNNTVFNIHQEPSSIVHAFTAMTQRHEILRTCFASCKDPRFGFVQVVLEAFSPIVAELSSTSGELAACIEEQMNKTPSAIDVASPPWRLVVLRAGDVSRLIVQMHHALYDGVAISVLFEEIEQSCRGAQLPNAVSYNDFLQRSLNVDLDAADEFWARLLSSYTPASFPQQAHAGSYDEDGYSSIMRLLETPLRNIEGFCQDTSTSTLAVLQSAWAKVIAAFTGENDVAFGNVVSGRTLALDELDRLVAPCFNTLPVRLEANAATTNWDAISRLQDLNADSLAHQFTPLRRIQKKISHNGQQLFDTLFIQQQPRKNPDASLWELVDDFGYMGYPLVCEATPDPPADKIWLCLHYSTSILQPAHVNIILKAYDNALRSIMETDKPFVAFRSPEIERCVASLYSQMSVDDGSIQATELKSFLKSKGVSVDDVFMTTFPATTSSTSEQYIIIQLTHDHQERERCSQYVHEYLGSAVKGIQLVFVKDLRRNSVGTLSRRALQETIGLDTNGLHLEEPTSEENAKMSQAMKAVRTAFSKFSTVPEAKIQKQTIFQLGLDSINAIQVANHLRAEGYSVTAEDVLSHSTVKKLTSFVFQQHGPGTVTEHSEITQNVSLETSRFARTFQAIGVNQKQVEKVIPCTAVQAGMLAESLKENGSVYINHFLLESSRLLDFKKLRKAWDVVMQRNQILRTGFATTDDALVPFIMICYLSNSQESPFEEVKGPQDASELQDQRFNIARDIHRSMSSPAWRVKVKNSDGKSFVQFTGHHALFDAESLRITFNEVRDIYKGLSIPAPQSIHAFLSHTESTREDRGGDHAAFWREMLKNPTLTRFPNLLPLKPTSRKVETKSHVIKLTWEEIRQKCQNLDASFQAVIQSTWSELLSIYTGEPDIIFGVVLSGRDVNDSVDINFPCAVTLPCRMVVTDDKRALLRDAMEYNSSVRRHQHFPLTRIQRAAGVGNMALFDTLLVLQRRTVAEWERTDFWDIIDEAATAEYSVSLEVCPTDEGTVDLRLVYWNDVIPGPQAVTILHQFEAMLSERMAEKSTITYPKQLLSHLAPEHDTLPIDGDLLHDVFIRAVERHSKDTALEFWPDLESQTKPRQWTYAQARDMSYQYANYLLDHGCTSGSVIATCFEKCPEAYFATLGILAAGSAFLAIDASAPAERKNFIVKDSSASALITSSSLAQQLAGQITVPVFAVEDIDLSKVSNSRPQITVTPESTSYCLYTSGSTGTPKGCIISHRNAVQFLAFFHKVFAGRWDPASRMMQFASYHFDVSVMEQFFSWSIGITLVSTPRDALLEDLAGGLNKLAITHIDLTPSLARLLTPEDVPSLCKGNFITGGEALNQEVLDSWGATEVIHNGYGPTEVTIGCTMYPRVPVNGKPSNIGWQYDNAGIYVLYPGTERIVPRGGIGELCISGVLVSKGYINRPDLNKERFPTLFGERIYRTGDLVRMLHNESLDFAGRIDDQVKLRGQRLELGEINATIKNLHHISDAATVVVTTGDTQSKQLVSFAVPEVSKISDELHILDDQTLAGRMLEACQARLPVYMVPSRVVMVNKIPLTSNNKIDSKSLKSVFAQLLETHRSTAGIENANYGSEVPMSQSEKAVLKVLAEFMSTPFESLSVESSPFQVGIDSISVFPFIKALKRSGFYNAETKTVLQCQTLRDLANALSRDRKSPSGAIAETQQSIRALTQRYRARAAKALGISPGRIKTIAACTALQQGIIARSFERKERQYFNQFAFDLDDTIDTHRLTDAWLRMISNIAILNTFFIPTDDGYIQVYAPLEDARQVVDCKCQVASEDSLQAAKRDWVAANSDAFTKPFEVIVYEGNSPRNMMIRIFHGLYDAISLNLLLATLAAEYLFLEPRYGPSFFGALPYGLLSKPKDADNFWIKCLEHATFNPIHEKGDTFNYATSHACVEHIDFSALPGVCRDVNVTLQAVAQACWISVLQERLGEPTIVGTIVSGRSIDVSDAESIIGPLFNTVPFWIQIEVDDTWASLAQKAHRQNLESLPFQHTPLRDISKALKRSTRDPLFDTLFVLQRQVGATDSLQPPWREVDSPAQADYPLSFEITELSDGSFSLNIVAQAEAVSEHECYNLLRRFEDVMKAFLKNNTSAVIDSMDGRFARSLRATPERDTSASLIKAKSHNDNVNNEVARTLIAQISSLAGQDGQSISVDTSIFELGLDSIDAIKLASRLKRNGLHLPLSKIMQNPIVGNMAEIATRSSLPDRATHESHVERMSSAIQQTLADQGVSSEHFDQVLAVTPIQEAMVAEMRSTEFINYLNHDVLELSPGTDIDRLLEAWREVISRNPILRTSFIEIADATSGFAFAQVIHPNLRIPSQILQIDGNQSFDLYFESQRRDIVAAPDDTPLFRLAVLQRGDSRCLALTMAHALYDGWSQNLMHHDVASAYRGQALSRPPYEPLLDSILASASGEAESFWKEAFADSCSCLVPTDNSDSGNANFEENHSSLPLQTIQSFCRLTNVTLQALGQLCWSLVLSTYVKDLEVAFGVIISGRDDEQAQEIMFPTMNTVGIRIALHGSKKEMLQYVQTNLAEVMQYQHYPLRKVQQMAGKKLFNTLFIYQKKPSGHSEYPALYKSVREASDLEYPVCVEMEIVEERLVWRAMGKSTALSRSGVVDLLNRLDTVLATIMHEPNAPVLHFSQQGTSVCGLEPFQSLAEDSPSSKTATQICNPKPQKASSRLEREIVADLSLISNIPQDEISLGQSIFHLGLDSISAIKISAALRKRDYRVPVSAIMRANTVQGIVEFIEASTNPVIASQSPEKVDAQQVLARELEGINLDKILAVADVKASTIEAALPATAVQTLFLTMWQDSQGSIFYPRFLYHVRGDVNNETITSAWLKLVEENQILRTILLSTGDPVTPIVQAVLSKPQQSSISFDSDTAQQGNRPRPLVNLQVARRGSVVTLGLRIHHALYDAVSHSKLLARFGELLNSISPPTQPPAVRFQDMIVLGHSSQARLGQESFWTSYLESTTQARLDTRTDVPMDQRTSLYKPSALPSVSSLESALQQSGLSIQSLFFASVAKTFLQYQTTSTDKQDVVLGIYLSNRSGSLAGVEALNAPTLNIVPLRLRSVRTANLAAIAHQAQQDIQRISAEPVAFTPLHLITQWTGVKVDVFVNFLRLPDEESTSSSNPSEDTIHLEEASEAETNAFNQSNPLPAFVEPRELQDNPVKGMYPPTIDIEAAVRQRGGKRQLDIGVFGPRAMVDEPAAEGWFKGIKSSLCSFSH